MLHVCCNAASACLVSAIDFVNRLMLSHLCALWYFARETGFALSGTLGSLLKGDEP